MYIYSESLCFARLRIRSDISDHRYPRRVHAMHTVGIMAIISESACIDRSWYVTNIVTPAERTLVSRCLTGQIRAKFAAQHLALVATQMKLQCEGQLADMSGARAKKPRYDADRKIAILHSLLTMPQSFTVQSRCFLHDINKTILAIKSVTRHWTNIYSLRCSTESLYGEEPQDKS